MLYDAPSCMVLILVDDQNVHWQKPAHAGWLRATRVNELEKSF